MATLGNDLKTLVIGEQAWGAKINQNTQKFDDYGLIIDLSSKAETTSINKGVICKVDEESGAGLAAGDVVRRTVSGATAANLTVEKYPATAPANDGTAGWHPWGVVKEVSSGVAYVITYGVAEVKIIASQNCDRGATVSMDSTGTAGQAKAENADSSSPCIGWFMEDVASTSAGQLVLCFIGGSSPSSVG